MGKNLEGFCENGEYSSTGIDKSFMKEGTRAQAQMCLKECFYLNEQC